MNFEIQSVSLTSLVSIHVLIHFSTHLSHHPRSHHQSLFHSFTPGSKPTFSANHLHLLYLLDCLIIMGLDRTYHAHRFIFSFTFYFLFIPCGRLSWLPVSFLLHVKYIVHTIVSYRQTAPFYLSICRCTVLLAPVLMLLKTSEVLIVSGQCLHIFHSSTF